MTIHNAADNSFKLIFGDHRLFSDFLNDFIHIDILKNIKPEDIEDISERFLPLFQDNRDCDTVKRINLKGTPLFVIAILEHESEVNHRSSFKMLQYICLVLDAWEKEVEKEKPGISHAKEFKYPPVLPIIFYDGKDTWTAEKNFLKRTALNKAFEKYIPTFEYELVNLNDYSEEEIMGISAALSIIMLIDKLRRSGEKNIAGLIPSDYAEKLNLQIPDSLRKLISDVIRVMLEKSGIERGKAEKVAAYFEARKERKGMFEAAIESIIEEREEARRDGMERGRNEGQKTGWNEGREAVARNALAEGLSLEFVQKITGLSREVIEKL